MQVIKGVKIAGITSRFPQKIEKTDDYLHFSKEEAEKFKKNVGIFERRIVDDNTCSSDLCEAASRDLMAGLNWSGDDVDILIMITQTGDYPVPATSIILQNKLGIKKQSICFDVNLGCSSFPYGLYIISSLISASGLNKGLLLIGDVSSKVCGYEDKSAYPLFGDAGCAIAFQRTDESHSISFDLMSDGAGFESIIIPTGGLASRSPPRQECFQLKEISQGIKRNDLNLILRGADIFSFAISKVPSSINSLVVKEENGIEDVNFLVLHQANKMINDQIIRKVNICPEKSLQSLSVFGNTSSASIPLTITHNIEKLLGCKKRILASGFGVGLSWGSVIFNLDSDVYYSHLELEVSE